MERAYKKDMYKDICDKLNIYPETEHSKALYDGTIDVMDISLREADALSQELGTASFFLPLCKVHLYPDYETFLTEIKKMEDRYGKENLTRLMIKYRITEAYWYFGHYKEAFYCLDRTDAYTVSVGNKPIIEHKMLNFMRIVNRSEYI